MIALLPRVRRFINHGDIQNRRQQQQRHVIYSAAMRSCLAFVLAILLSLNATFAVAARYCQHQQESPQAAHFGHHSHHHSSAADKSSGPGAQVDLDCGFCHLSFSSFVPTLQPMLDDNNLSQLVVSPAAGFHSATVDPFDRPPLARLA